jgi:hypothetical protein
MSITQEQLESLEGLHKRVAYVIGKDKAWEIVLRKPNRTEYKAFRSRTHKPDQVADAQEILCRQIVVGVDTSTGALIATDPASTKLVRDTFDALLEEWPGIPESCADTLQDLVGMSGTEQGKE